MNRNPRAGGVIGVAIGVALLAYCLPSTPTPDKGILLLLALGVMMLPISIALVALPSRLLLMPQQVGGRVDHEALTPGWTILARGIQLVEFLAGFAAYASLRTGY